MLLEGEHHQRGRKAILPSLQARAIETQMATIKNVVSHEVDSWPLDTPFPVQPRLRMLALQIILTTIFGGWDDFLQMLYKRLSAMLVVTPTLTLQEPRLRKLPGWRGQWTHFLRQREKVDELIIGYIESRRDNRNDCGGMIANLFGARNPDGSHFSCKQLRDNIMTMVIAGHETTASELAWAFQLLAHHPSVRRRLTSEIDHGTSTDYLAATVLETLRHRPVFPFTIPREVRQAVEIDGHTYDSPTWLLGCVYLMHHNTEFYKEPHQFKPERFLGKRASSYAWLPWSGGRRRCPGHNLAMLEMQMVLRTTLAERDILPASKTIESARWRGVILTPHAGARVILHRRRRTSKAR